MGMMTHSKNSNFRLFNPKHRFYWLLWLLVGCLLFQAVPEGLASAADAGDEASASFESLQHGKRLTDPNSYTAPSEPTVYLTFDDGPSDITPGVLDTLKEKGVHATFFVIGEDAKAYPDTMRRIAAEGHAIGNHTYNHQYEQLYTSFSAFWKQISETDRIIRDLTGHSTRLLRAPGGTYMHFDAFYYYYLEQAGYLVYDWTVDSEDSKRAGVPTKEIVTTVEQSPLSHETIVLMHDGAGHRTTAAGLASIIDYYKEKGYVFGTLNETVKPSQFRIAPTKWKRSYSLESHSAMLAQMSEARKNLLAASVPATGGASQQETGDANSPSVSGSVYGAGGKQQPDFVTKHLTVQSQAGFSEGLKPSQFEMKKGRFYVPLRQLCAAIGAEVGWDSERGEAIVHAGAVTAVYRTKDHAIVTKTAQGTGTTSFLSDWELRDGAIWVPLRFTAGLLGQSVASYQLETEASEVTIAPDLARQLYFTL